MAALEQVASGNLGLRLARWTAVVEAIQIPLSGNILAKAVAYCGHYRDSPPAEEDGGQRDPIHGWDLEFTRVDQATLFEMILAANFLDIKPMLDLTCRAVGEMIRGRTPAEIRAHFNITNDFTPEEEEQVRRENEWVD